MPPLAALTLAALACLAAAGLPAPPPAARGLAARGGAVATPSPALSEADAAVAWHAMQVETRRQRLTRIAQSLNATGLPFVADGERAAAARAAAVQAYSAGHWAVAVSTAAAPFECLLHVSVAPGRKVCAPAGSVAAATGGGPKWVGLRALNEMRRKDPSKVRGLWFDQYDTGMRTLSGHAGPAGRALDALLETRTVLRSAEALAFAAVFVAAAPAAARALVAGLTSGVFWRQHQQWSRLSGAPLPIKIMLGRWAYLWGLQRALAAEEGVRGVLIDLEGALLEAAVPVSFAAAAAEVGVGLGEAEE